MVGGCLAAGPPSGGPGAELTDPVEERGPPPLARGLPGFPGPRHARPAEVVAVADGDTVSLSGLGSTRLIGVDSPAVYGGAECFGAQASAYTKRVLRPRRRVRYRLGLEPRDRYGRALAYVWLTDGRLFNGLLVEGGLAVPLAIAPNTELAGRFRAAAERAQRSGRGLWAHLRRQRGPASRRRAGRALPAGPGDGLLAAAPPRRSGLGRPRL